ncbi:MAG: metalloprotease TldD [Acidiferrobacteraceae bacterium]|nr:metalloprotease TldD [Acidiferrobacteraceae bacterium]|tara:strand:+ start:105 stop:1550 length:1446 start_codon:yes stop_codon:yes gene_type:complete
MSNFLDKAKGIFLEPAGIELQDIDKLVGRIMSYDVDYADLYFQYTQSESWMLEDGMVKSGSRSIDQGVGIRAISGEKTGFAYSDEIKLPVLIDAADAARAIAYSGGKTGQSMSWTGNDTNSLYTEKNPLSSFTDEEKVELLHLVESEARSFDSRISQVIASLSAVHDVVLIARHDGYLSADIRPLIRLNVHVIAESKGRREQGSAGGGGRYTYSWLIDNEHAIDFAHDAARQAIVNLDAINSPAGEMKVVLGPGWPGILLHEAIGHGLEGDFNRKKTSAFSGLVGQKIATSECTVVDDGTISDRRGSLTVDDEGTSTQNTILIENGVLKGYMQDNLNAQLMGVQSTGNGRRESYAHLPMPRMTNTYMLPGALDPAEIIGSVTRGLYAVNFGGGQVDITSGKFVFSASEAYLIENGQIAQPVKGATLIGNGPDVLNRVKMVGSDLQLDSGVGTCGKEGQSVPVGVGQPTLRIDGLTVGGVEV